MKPIEHFNQIANRKIVGTLKKIPISIAPYEAKTTNMTFVDDHGNKMIRCWGKRTVQEGNKKIAYQIMYDIVDRFKLEKKTMKNYGWEVDPAIKEMTPRDRYYARKRLRNA